MTNKFIVRVKCRVSSSNEFKFKDKKEKKVEESVFDKESRKIELMCLWGSVNFSSFFEKESGQKTN